MDAKSTVSSFYGGRRNSSDALNARSRRDDVSSFLAPTSQSAGDQQLNDNNVSSAGYNRMSFLHTGREEPLKGGHDEDQQTWDVYADFNNVGPRYSAAFVQSQEGSVGSEIPIQSNNSRFYLFRYQKLNHTPTKTEDVPPPPGVEMVTVPALGPEWKRSELRDMTKAAKREARAEVRREKLKQWYRDQRGLCGGWLTRRLLVFIAFGLCLGCVSFSSCRPS